VIENIFLDAGGVLINEDEQEKLKASIITDILKSYSQSYTQENYWKDVQEAVFRFVPRVYDYVIWKNVNDVDVYKKTRSQYIERWNDIRPKLILMDGAAEIVPALAEHFRLGILGQYGHELIELLDLNNILHHFTYKDTQDDFKITKPDPRYFIQVLNKAGVKASGSFMVGDRIDKDIIPAKQAGMKTVRIKTGLHKDQTPRVFEEMPDHEYASIYGLLELCISDLYKPR
jgi:HAD superfamily hydrolase (TIGR01549 family)